MPEPKRLRLLKVTAEGYLLGSGLARKHTHILVPHEALVALLTGLVKPETASEVFGDKADAFDCLPLRDLASGFRRQAQGVAWRLGCCSWDNQHRAIPLDGNPIHASD